MTSGPMTFPERFSRIWRSFRGIPVWVQFWVAILILVNATSFLLTGPPAGFWTAMAACAVVTFNLPILLWQAGVTRLLSIPHIVWIPLVIYLGWRLGLASDPATGGEFVYGLVVLIVNTVSLGFDAVDGWRWLRGEREIMGLHEE